VVGIKEEKLFRETWPRKEISKTRKRNKCAFVRRVTICIIIVCDTYLMAKLNLS